MFCSEGTINVVTEGQPYVYYYYYVLTKDTDSSYLISASQHVGAEEAKINRSDSSATHD